MSPRPLRVVVRVLPVLVLIGLAWASAAVGLFTWIGLPFTAVGALVAAIRRSPLGWWLIATPLPLAAVLQSMMAASSYMAGTAHLREYNGYSSVDPTTRLPVATQGSCFSSPDDWLRELTHDATLRVIVGVLGPPDGAYLGPFPSKQELDAILGERGEPIRLDDLRHGMLQPIDGRRLADLGTDLGGAVLMSTTFPTNEAVPWARSGAPHDRPLFSRFHGDAAELGDGTFVIRVCDIRGAVVLLDTIGRRIIARHRDDCTWRDLPSLADRDAEDP